MAFSFKSRVDLVEWPAWVVIALAGGWVRAARFRQGLHAIRLCSIVQQLQHSG